MNIQRAKEISESATMAHVTFDGVPVYIQRVNEATGTARVYPLDEPEKEQEISIQQLVEH